MTGQIAILLECLLPEALAPFLEATVGDAIPREGRDGRFLVSAAGRFSGHVIGDLMAQAGNHESDAALVLVEDDVVRVLYFERGRVVGADSNVLFERLGRILGRVGKVSPEDAAELIDQEEQGGLRSIVPRLPPHALPEYLEMRVREIACGLYFMPHAHYFLVEGRPNLGSVPPLSLTAMELVVEGLRRYDEWRNRSTAPKPEPPPPPEPSRLAETPVDLDEAFSVLNPSEPASFGEPAEPPPPPTAAPIRAPVRTRHRREATS